MVDRIVPRAPARVLDVATGTAGVALQLATRTRAGVIGVDLTLAMLKTGRRRSWPTAPGDRVQLVAGRGEQLPFPDAAFDALTFTYLLRYVDDPAGHPPGAGPGRQAGWDRGQPGVPGAAPAFLAGLVVAVHAAGAARRRPGGRRAGRGSRSAGSSGPNISAHYRQFPVAWTVEAWRTAGFDDIQVRLMSLGGGLVMSGTRRRD